MSLKANKVNLIFYGDQSKALMFKTALLSFDDGAKIFIPGERASLNKAVKEALIEKSQQLHSK